MKEDRATMDEDVELHMTDERPRNSKRIPIGITAYKPRVALHDTAFSDSSHLDVGESLCRSTA